MDKSEVLNRVMDEVITVTRAERGFVMLHEGDGQLHFHVARGIDQQTIDTPEFHISRGLVACVAEEGKPLLTSDAQSDNRLRMRHSVVNLRLRSILCVPMQFREKTGGRARLLREAQAAAQFTHGDITKILRQACLNAPKLDYSSLTTRKSREGDLGDCPETPTLLMVALGAPFAGGPIE